MATLHPSHKNNPVFHPRKSPERVLQSQIDAAQREYLWACAAFHHEQNAYPGGHWARHFSTKATRFKRAWLTLLEVQRNG